MSNNYARIVDKLIPTFSTSKNHRQTRMQHYLRSTVVIIIICLFTSNVKSQTNIYEWFDTATGKTDLALYNGPMYFNQYRSLKPENNPFLDKDEFSLGEVDYDGQVFYNMPLKYDIYRDVLLVQPREGGNFKSVQLIASRVQSFSFNSKKFVNLGLTQTVEIPAGYYEESVVNRNFTFYIKHRKTERDIINGQSVFNDYGFDNLFYVYKNGKFTQVKSKRNIISLFPELKIQISDYYNNKRASDTPFMEGLFKYLNTILK